MNMNTQRPAARDITRITLGVVFIGLMITASLWVLLPFVGATVWATMIVVATWPIMIGLQARLGGRRWLAGDDHDDRDAAVAGGAVDARGYHAD
jgi:predicted PurR-regulated permease PerM